MGARLVRHHDEEQIEQPIEAVRPAPHTVKIDKPLDVLIAAVIMHLPPAGAEFSAPARRKWLDMMAMAFDVAYGAAELAAHEEARQLGAVGMSGHPHAAPPSSAPAPAAARRAHAGHDYYIAADGTACNSDGVPVLISDVPADETVFDYRPVTGEFRDTSSIIWADGQRGLAGLAPGVSFCGPG